MRLFEHQRRYNKRYARYCAQIGALSPASWEAIPAVPAAAFKEAALTTFEPARAALVFETSGTSSGRSGRHCMESSALYDASLLASFDRFVLRGNLELRYLNLVPNPLERPQSSLGYMMAQVSGRRGDGATGWYLRGDELLFEPFIFDVGRAIADCKPVCIATTAFALVHLLDAMKEHHVAFTLPRGSRIMETGGFKGRTRVVDRDELHARARWHFGIEPHSMIAEYGMTELTSQYYDVNPPAKHKAGPPWLRTRVVGPQRSTLPNGTVGSLLHIDLANRSSCIAVQTEDLGAQTEEGLILIGREHEASLRGCSLDAETLVRNHA